MLHVRLSDALREARLGRKDESRKWLYFVLNTGLVEILNGAGYDTGKIKVALRELQSAVHPLEVYHTSPADLGAVLDEIRSLRETVERLDRLTVNDRPLPPPEGRGREPVILIKGETSRLMT